MGKETKEDVERSIVLGSMVGGNQIYRSQCKEVHRGNAFEDTVLMTMQSCQVDRGSYSRYEQKCGQSCTID